MDDGVQAGPSDLEILCAGSDRLHEDFGASGKRQLPAFSVPVLYLPYATFPAEKQRASGLLIPDVGDSTSKGFIFGDAVYWAPTDWADMTLGSNYYSRRGWAQRGELRMRPWENAKLDVSYTGVVDRGLRQSDGTLVNQGGHEARLLFTALLPDGWRAVADLDNLSSLTYRLAFSETYVQAVNSEVRNQAFLTNNFRGFSLNIAALSYQNYLSATPDTYVSLRAAPEVRFSSVDQAPWKHLPFYFSFDVFSDAAHRSDTVTGFHTDEFCGAQRICAERDDAVSLGPMAGRDADIYAALDVLRRANSKRLVRQRGFVAADRRVVGGYPAADDRARVGKFGFRHKMETCDRAGLAV